MPATSKANFLKKLSAQITDMLPSHLVTLKNDFEKNCHQFLDGAITKMDLVTRHDFEVQSKVLARTRKKIEELEHHLKEIEKLLKSKHRK